VQSTDKRPLVVSDNAHSPDVVACDKAASDPRDSDKPADVNGIDLDRRASTSAITACKNAIAVAGAPRRVFYQLSRAYEAKGESVDAINSLRKAADLGHPLASYALAERLVAGRGVPKDPATAMALYFKAADAGLNVALVKVGMMYAQGDGTERDYVKAVALYNLALKVREPSVYPELGALYLNGRGVTRDKRKACDLFEQGASLGNRVAARSVTSFCKS
jgi:hypothetical protein